MSTTDDETRPATGSDSDIAGRKLSERAYLSSLHMWTAAHHAKVCEQLEKEMIEQNNEYEVLHMSSAISTVISANAFMESLVNELFQDAADLGSKYRMYHRAENIDERAVRLMGRFWTSKGAERNLAPLDKYQMALLMCGAEKMDEGKNPYQNAMLLVRLRNDSIHFKPLTSFYGEVQKLEEKLADRFPPNKALADGHKHAWFPTVCLGAGCAVWSRDSAIALADEWCDRLGISKHYKTGLPSYLSVTAGSTEVSS